MHLIPEPPSKPRTGRSTSVLAIASMLPLAAVMLVIISSMVNARGPLPSAHAASNITVTGEHLSEVSLDSSGCAPSALTIGDLVPGSDPWTTVVDRGGTGCAISFGTTGHASGVALTVQETSSAASGGAAAMRCTSAECSTDSLDDYQGATEPVQGSSAFGAQLLGASGGATAVWAGDTAVHDIADTADTACHTSGVVSGTCTFTFGASASVDDPAGSYAAQVRFVALAR